MRIVLGIWGLLFLDLGFQLLMGRVADPFNGYHNALGVVLLQLMLQQFLGNGSDNLSLDPPNPTSFVIPALGLFFGFFVFCLMWLPDFRTCSKNRMRYLRYSMLGKLLVLRSPIL